ncbi:MAG: LysM peptidoglycan-binding domain-containing protein [Proteobacteria bacterium]|nr:LysM peptidoglycan-binding domain-containing protein [Pseudomonadota bacterium]
MKLCVRGPTCSWWILSIWLGMVGLLSGCSTSSEDNLDLEEPANEQAYEGNEGDFDNGENLDVNSANGNSFGSFDNEDPNNLALGDEEATNSYNQDSYLLGENDVSGGNYDGNNQGNEYANAESEDYPEVGEGDDLAYQDPDSNDGVNSYAAEGSEDADGEIYGYDNEGGENFAEGYSEDGENFAEGYNENSEGIEASSYSGLENDASYNNVINSEIASSQPEGNSMMTGDDSDSEMDAYGEDGVENPYSEGDLAASSDYGSSDAMPMASSGGLPEPGSKMHYIVQKGDTLASIAEKIYGDREQWRVIQQLTGMENPHRIYPGDVVYYQLSEQAQAFAAAYENTPKGEVTVEAGDTLSSIAARVYGDSGQWQSLWRANDMIDNPDRLTVGQLVYFVDNSSVMAEKERIEAQILLAKSKVSKKEDTNIEMTMDMEYNQELYDDIGQDVAFDFLSFAAVAVLDDVDS